MDITRKADQTTSVGSPDFFTGRVTISGQFQREAPSRVGGAIVHFEPGARTAWHTHPLGQTLIVTQGVGLAAHLRLCFPWRERVRYRPPVTRCQRATARP